MNKELKKKIVSSYETSTPDILDKIKDHIQSTDMLEEDITVTPIHRYHKLTHSLAIACSLAAAILIFVVGIQTGNRNIKFSMKSAPASDMPMEEPAATATESMVEESFSDAAVCNELFVNTESESARSNGAGIEKVMGESAVEDSFTTKIYIDVDYGMSLSLDENICVLDYTIEDGTKDFAAKENVTGLSFDDAFKNIVSNLFMNGHFKEDEDVLLISIDAVSEETYASISLSLKTIINTSSLANQVIIQDVETDKLIDMANAYNISVGKMQLVEKAIESSSYNSEDVKALSAKSISELKAILYGINHTYTPSGENEAGCVNDSIIELH